jgi:hypothetical protein
MRLLIATLIFLLTITTAQASDLDADIELNQLTLRPGDKFIATIFLKNNLDTAQNITILAIFKNRQETEIHLPPERIESVDSKKEKSVQIFNIDIEDSFSEGIYDIETVIISDKDTIRFERQVEVSGTLKDMEIEIHTCKDRGCKERSKIFIQSENIYLSYKSQPENVILEASLEYPDKSLEKIQLPISIRPSQIGTYTLEISASRNGYQDLVKSTNFAVIDAIPEIKSISICEIDGICQGKETNQNCPQDCPPEEIPCKSISDGKCNPDCRPSEDPDCQFLQEKKITTQKKSSDKILLVLILAACLILIIALTKTIHKKK